MRSLPYKWGIIPWLMNQINTNRNDASNDIMETNISLTDIHYLYSVMNGNICCVYKLCR